MGRGYTDSTSPRFARSFPRVIREDWNVKSLASEPRTHTDVVVISKGIEIGLGCSNTRDICIRGHDLSEQNFWKLNDLHM